MATKKHNIIVLAASIIIAIAISFIQWKSHDPEHFESRVYEAENGWGYDILVNDRLLIHQASIPAIEGNRGFSKKEQAERTACLIINKMKRGESPMVTKFEIHKICDSIAENGQQGKRQ